MTKVKYSASVYASTLRNKLSKDILQAVESSPSMRKEISRVFQQANRRIQNIEKSGLLSPAASALNRADAGYTKFSMKQSWTDLKTDYARAIQFLKQPTSTASGTRQYNKHLMKEYGLTADEFNLMARELNGKLNSVDESDFVERYLMRYKDFTGELEQSARDISQQIESDAKRLADAIQNDLDEQADNIAGTISDSIADILNSFDDFSL